MIQLLFTLLFCVRVSKPILCFLSREDPLAFVLHIAVLLYGSIYLYNCYIFFLDWSFDHYVVSFFVSFHSFYFKVYFIWYEYCYSCFLLVSICVEYIFPALHFQSVWLPSPSAVILEPKKIRSFTVSIVSSSICCDMMRQEAKILVFWRLSFNVEFHLVVYYRS